MKKKICKTLLLTSMLWLGLSLNATAQCVIINDPNAQPGFTPAPNQQPCFVRGEVGELTIQMKNFGVITNDVFVISTRVDSVLNLPAGLTWSFNVPAANAANTLLADENGCLAITGTTNDLAATYNLDLFVTVEVSLSGNVNTVAGKASELEALFMNTFGFEIDLSYFVKVVGIPTDCDNIVGVKELKNITGLNVYPNPAQSNATLSFNSNASEKLNAQLVDLLGRIAWKEEIDVQPGQNTIQINKQAHMKGLYLLTLTNGKAASVNRLFFE